MSILSFLLCIHTNKQSYAFSLKNTLSENGDKFDATDKETLEKAVNDTISKLETMETAEKEEFEEVQKELEAVANPILQKFYGSQGGAPGGAPGGFPGAGGPGGAAGGNDGPSVEEVD